jgi:hypothetical protein
MGAGAVRAAASPPYVSDLSLWDIHRTQAPLLAQQLLGFANATQPRYPLTDWYDASDASYVGFAARAQVGGVFAPVWVQGLRARAVGGS